MSSTTINGNAYQGALSILGRSVTEAASTEPSTETASQTLTSLVNKATKANPLHPGKTNSAGAYVDYLQSVANGVEAGQASASTAASSASSASSDSSSSSFYERFSDILAESASGLSSSQDPTGFEGALKNASDVAGLGFREIDSTSGNTSTEQFQFNSKVLAKNSLIVGGGGDNYVITW
jgi:hypothetical protein